MSDQERDPQFQDKNLEETPIDTENVAPEENTASETMWAAVRDNDVLTGEEVALESTTSDTTTIVGGPASMGEDTTWKQPEDTSFTSTTIPAITDVNPAPLLAEVSADDASAEAEIADVLQHREEPVPADMDDTIIQRRALVDPEEIPVVEETPERTSWINREVTPHPMPVQEYASENLDDAIFDGSSMIPTMPSRTAAHLWSLFTLFVAPVAWYLASDAYTRIVENPAGAASTGNLQFLPIVELIGAIALMILLLVLMMRSSLGAWLTGLAFIVAGLPWLIVPNLVKDVSANFLATLERFNAFGGNLSHHIQSSGYSGGFVLLGLIILGYAIMSHFIRRTGRREEMQRMEIATVNPSGAHYTARARRKAAKEMGLI